MVGCGIDQPHHLFLAENGRQLMRHLGKDEVVEGEILPLQRPLVQEVTPFRLRGHREEVATLTTTLNPSRQRLRSNRLLGQMTQRFIAGLAPQVGNNKGRYRSQMGVPEDLFSEAFTDFKEPGRIAGKARF